MECIVTSLALVCAAAEGLLLEWPLRTDLLDASGNGHEGSIRGSARLAGDGLAFDGSEAWLQADTSLPELTDEFTIECRVRPEAAQRPYACILGNHKMPHVGFALQRDAERGEEYYFTYGTGNGWVYSRNFALPAGEWRLVTVTRSGGRLRVYLDGLLISSTEAPMPMAPSDTVFLVGLGIWGEPRWFAGQIADVRIYGSARRPESTASPERQLEAFAGSGSLERVLEPRWGLLPAGGAARLTLRLEPEAVPPAIDRVQVRLEGLDAPTTVTLSREAGFSASIDLGGLVGLREVEVQATAYLADGRAAELRSEQLTLWAAEPEETFTRPTAARAPFEPAAAGRRTVPLEGAWRIATDPTDAGVAERWMEAVRPEAVATRVPWIIQGPFPGYHGLAWYWREVAIPEAVAEGERVLLRFEAVDYQCDAWLNGVPLGSHEGGEDPFELDATDAARRGEPNLLALRVLNPTHEAIDGIRLNEAPRRAKVIPYSAGASYNHGGIVGAVELALAPAAGLSAIHLIPDPTTGRIRVELTARNEGTPREACVRIAVGPAQGGPELARAEWVETLASGETALRADLTLEHPRLWELDDPFLYRVSARLETATGADELTDRCGFRDFRFERGAFRLNGRRVFLRGTHTVNATPIGQQVPDDPSRFQRDLVLLKAMGFNMIRFIWGGATRRQLDMCDEMGLMAYVEHAAANPMQDTPAMPARFAHSVASTVLRDRNHASVVMWGLLNETQDGPVFREAVGILPLVRSLDATRMVMLNSGRWDGRWEIGSLANPGCAGWEPCLGAEAATASPSGWGAYGGYFRGAGDAHVYPRVPHDTATVRGIRSLGEGTGPVFLTEYGTGSAVDLWRLTRTFEALGAEGAEDAQYYRARLERFLADFDAWRLEDSFADPQGFFAASLSRMAVERTRGLDAIRANPSLVGYSLTGMMDHVNCGEGLWTLFRELKPGTVDALAEGLAPLRLCLFVEPHNLAPGGEARLEAVLANEDFLPPGDYPVRIQLLAPDGSRPLDETVTVTVPASTPEREAPLAIPFYDRPLRLEGPAGAWRFRATMLRGGAPTGGEKTLAVLEPERLDGTSLTLIGGSASLREWLTSRGAEVRGFGDAPPASGEAIVVAGRPEGDEAAAWAEIARRTQGGARTVVLDSGALAKGEDPTGWLPLAERPSVRGIHSWLYLVDHWAKRHPLFEGLPAGGLMDFDTYANIVPDLYFVGGPPPEKAIAGGVKASQEYDAGLTAWEQPLGEGRLLVSTLRILENLGSDPVAERLLGNAVRWAAMR